jgi:hypothetical protein
LTFRYRLTVDSPGRKILGARRLASDFRPARSTFSNSNLEEKRNARMLSVAAPKYFLAGIYLNTGTIQANLHYLDYLMLKEADEDR